MDVGMRLAFVLALAVDTLVILIAIVRAWSVNREKPQPSFWTTLLLREGVLYFVAQLVWGVWNMAAIAVTTATLHSTVLTGTDMAVVNVYLALLPSILISRFYLNVHELHVQELQKQKASDPVSPPGTFAVCDHVKEEGYRTSYVFEVLVYNGRNHQSHIV
ncbi:hypothetical protein C8Q74DRAFT_1365930 [Fomes fomentarius]|nr:hypothetical protein C8Q74DRAFT_1365930 [Fomes fomentarius]